MSNYEKNFQILNGPSEILMDESLIKLEIPLPHEQFEVISTYNLSSNECFTLVLHIKDISADSPPYSEIAANTLIHEIKFDDVLLEIDSIPSEGIQILVYNDFDFNASDINEITALIRKYSYTALKYLDDEKKRGHGGILTR